MGSSTPCDFSSATSTSVGIFQTAYCDTFASGGLIDSAIPGGELALGMTLAFFVALAIIGSILGAGWRVTRH